MMKKVESIPDIREWMGKKIFLFGAGMVSDLFIRVFEDNAVEILGIVVSHTIKPNPTFNGYRVFSINEIESNETIVLTVLPMSQNNIYQSLLKFGIKNVYGISENNLEYYSHIYSNQKYRKASAILRLSDMIGMGRINSLLDVAVISDDLPSYLENVDCFSSQLFCLNPIKRKYIIVMLIKWDLDWQKVIELSLEYGESVILSCRLAYIQSDELMINEMAKVHKKKLVSYRPFMRHRKEYNTEDVILEFINTDVKERDEISMPTKSDLNPKVFDVGIVGNWSYPNYGAEWTYFALFRTLKEMGKTVLMIEWPEDSIRKPAGYAVLFEKQPYTNDEIALWSISSWEMRKNNSRCKAFIHGSDQMLHRTFYREMSKNAVLPWVDVNHKKIGYAMSFGHEDPGYAEFDRLEAGMYIRQFDRISVREESAKKYMKNLLDTESDLVLDPVFLPDNIIWKDYINDGEGDYICSYIMDPDHHKMDTIFQISCHVGLKAVFLVDRGIDIPGDILNQYDVYQDVSAEKWLSLIANSKHIITDSYHGTCFAIIFNKSFVTICNERRGSVRFVNLLKMLKLESRLLYKFDEKGIMTLMNKEIDYNTINELLSLKRKESFSWLREAIEENHKYPGSEELSMDLSMNLKPGVESVCRKLHQDGLIVPNGKCTGCAACRSICPTNAIVMKEDSEGFLHPVILDSNKCIKCDKCKDVCPVLHVDRIPLKKPKRCFAAYSLDRETRYTSTSGGLFSELALFFIRKGGVCYGASYQEDMKVRHIRIDEENDIVKIRQSKYYQSDISNAFFNVKKDIKEGKEVLFCGTPCQCAGLIQFIGKQYENLYICDFICHSISSPKAFLAYIKEKEARYGERVSRIWFKNKEISWKQFSLRLDFQDNIYRKPYWEDAYFQAFLHRHVIGRPSCYYCDFKGFRRVSDFTLADYWGLKWSNKEKGEDDTKDGVSLVMLNSEKGISVFEEIKKRCYVEEHELSEALEGNPYYYNCEEPGRYRDFFWQNIDHIPFSELQNQIKLKEQKDGNSGIRVEMSKNIKKNGNCIIELDDSSELIVNGFLEMNANLPQNSNQECIIRLRQNSKLIVNGYFRLYYGTTIQVFEGGCLTLGSGFFNTGTVVGVAKKMTIGNDFMGARNVTLYDSDHHGIINEQGDLINSSEKVVIGNHVWVGEGATVLKDVCIEDNAIIGAHSVVTKDIPENCIVVGNPAKIVKTNVNWRNHT